MKIDQRVAGFCVALFLSACGGGGGDDAPVLATTCSVEYTVSSIFAGNTASITYSNSTGGTEQKNQTLPGSIFYPFVSSGSFLYISAQNQTNAGSIQVAIKVNGNIVKSATSSGAYAIATASTTCN